MEMRLLFWLFVHVIPGACHGLEWSRGSHGSIRLHVDTVTFDYTVSLGNGTACDLVGGGVSLWCRGNSSFILIDTIFNT